MSFKMLKKNSFLLSFHLLFFLVLIVSVSAQSVGTGIEADLDAVFGDPSFARSLWGVKVVSLRSGKTIYEKNAHKLLIPASNMKILTAAAALRVLGEDYVFRTPILTTGRLENGVMKGDLIIGGSGDPSLGARFKGNNRNNPLSGDPWKVFAGWADKLSSLGIKRIEGDIVGDVRLFEPVNQGRGWAWDDLRYGYAAGFGPLQFNETTAFIEIKPGMQVGSPVGVRLIPCLESMKVTSELKIVPPELDTDIEIIRNGRHFHLCGEIAKGSGIFYQSVALPDPAGYFLDMLLETLRKNGIEVSGDTRILESVAEEPDNGGQTLFIHTSPPLSQLLTIMMEVSQNQYAETIFRLLDKREAGKSDEGAAKVMEKVISSMGAPSDSYEIIDGSGLSRNNLLTADTIVRILQYMHRHDQQGKFAAMLPKSGIKGTIRGRMTGTRAVGKVSAKTGTLSWVRALSGYLETEKGEMLAFSILVNHYNQPRQAAEYLQDQALEILVGYE